MVLAQTLGLVHAVAHGGHAGASFGGPVLQAKVGGAADAAWLGKAFGAHHDDGDCQLYDQASHGDCVPSVAQPPLPPQVPSSPLPFFMVEPLRAAATAFHARGPPPVR
jgi:hypothetical protein